MLEAHGTGRGSAVRKLIFTGHWRSWIAPKYLEPLEPITNISLYGLAERTADDEWDVSPITANDLRELKWLPLLSELHIHAELTPDAWKTLGEFRQLRSLYLKHIPSSEYVNIGKLTDLTHLEFRMVPQMEPSAIRPIARLPKLKVLNLEIWRGQWRETNGTILPITILPGTIDAQMRELAKLPAISRFETHGLDDSSLLAFTECVADSRLTNLAELRLSRCLISDAGLKNLARLPSLIHLDLSNTQVTDGSLETLQTIPWLRTLYLQRCEGITDNGADQLSEMMKLESLNVSQTRLTRTGLLKLAALKRLRSLWFSDHTDSVLSELQNELSPGCRIIKTRW